MRMMPTLTLGAALLTGGCHDAYGRMEPTRHRAGRRRHRDGGGTWRRRRVPAALGIRAAPLRRATPGMTGHYRGW